MMLASHKSYFGVKTRGTQLDVGIFWISLTPKWIIHHPSLFPRHLCGSLHCFIMSHFWFLEMRWKGVRAACCEAAMDPRASFDAEASRGLCWARARATVSYSQCLIGISSMAIYMYILNWYSTYCLHYYINMHTHTHAHTHIHIYIYTHTTYTYIYIYIYIYNHIHIKNHHWGISHCCQRVGFALRAVRFWHRSSGVSPNLAMFNTLLHGLAANSQWLQVFDGGRGPCTSNFNGIFWWDINGIFNRISIFGIFEWDISNGSHFWDGYLNIHYIFEIYLKIIGMLICLYGYWQLLGLIYYIWDWFGGLSPMYGPWESHVFFFNGRLMDILTNHVLKVNGLLIPTRVHMKHPPVAGCQRHVLSPTSTLVSGGRLMWTEEGIILQRRMI